MMLASQDAAARIMALFDGNVSHHGTHGMPELDDNGGKWGIRKTAKTVKGPPTAELWQQHLDGKRPLGVVPIRDDEQGSCSWGCIDVDDYDVETLDVVQKIETNKLPLLPCRSKSGGLHLFMLTSAPVPSAQMQAVLGAMAASLGFEGCEIFPKQKHLDVDRGDNGSWMVVPYYGGDFGGKLRMQHGLKKTGAEMSISEFLTAAEKMRLDPEQFAALPRSSGGRRKAKSEPRVAGPEPDEPFGDGPPCLQTLARDGIKPGAQNNALLQMGVYYKKKDTDGWRGPLEKANQEYLTPPGSQEGLDSVIKSLSKKDYQYKCNDQPMCAVCDAKLCRTREFGVGNGTKTPVIVSLRKLSSKNPVWYVTVEGSNREMEIKQAEDIASYRRFAIQCFKQLNIAFSPMNAGAWAAVLDEALTRMDEEQASPDTTKEGWFLELLETFLTNRQRGMVREDLHHGKPWLDEEKEQHHFMMSALVKFLVREGMKDANAHDCGTLIRELGGDRVSDTPTTVKGKGVRLWFVPGSAVQAMPEPSIPETPTDKI